MFGVFRVFWEKEGVGGFWRFWGFGVLMSFRVFKVVYRVFKGVFKGVFKAVCKMCEKRVCKRVCKGVCKEGVCEEVV